MKSALRELIDRYFTVDARTLGLFRIVFGLHLLANLYDRTKGSDAIAFYTNQGVLPNHFALFAPMAEHQLSLLSPFSTLGQVRVAFVFIVLVYGAYVIGWHTKLAQILVVVCWLSLTNRNLILQNGGIVVTNVVAVWTMFLPLGARFSVDHLLRSLRERRETLPAELNERAPMIVSEPRFRRVAFFGILLNFACVYFFNYAHKVGTTWRDGSAVHWVLWQNRIATIWAAMLRMHEPAWLSPVLTRGTLVIEEALPLLLLFPIAQKWTRRAALLAIFSLHCGISLMMTLGPFSYSMMSFSLLLVSGYDWDFVRRFWVKKGAPLRIQYDPTIERHHRLARLLARLDGRRALEFVDSREDAAPSFAVPLYAVVRSLPLGSLYAWPLKVPAIAHSAEKWLRRSDTLPENIEEPFVDSPVKQWARAIRRGFGEILAALLLATLSVQILTDNWIIADRFRVKHRPEVMKQIVEYLRLPQGWSMFSPEAPKEDGTVVIDAVLSDGRHIDPRKQRPPDFEAALHGPWFDDQQWCDWDLRMKWDGSRYLHPYFREYIAHLDELDSWHQSASIRSFEVYWVNNSAPPPGSTQPYNIQKQLLFTSGIRP
jgi:hypothetical protein